MEKINLTLPSQYKIDFIEMASEEGISASELLRRWIREKTIDQVE
jgi:hypothetical protein